MQGILRVCYYRHLVARHGDEFVGAGARRSIVPLDD